jgi:hypothetical protein
MLNTYQIFISLHKERQNDLIRFLNFIATQINTEKLNKKSINKKCLEYLLSKVSYNMYCRFESQHRHRYSIKNILKEFDITLMEHEKIKKIVTKFHGL